MSFTANLRYALTRAATALSAAPVEVTRTPQVSTRYRGRRPEFLPSVCTLQCTLERADAPTNDVELGHHEANLEAIAKYIATTLQETVETTLECIATPCSFDRYVWCAGYEFDFGDLKVAILFPKSSGGKWERSCAVYPDRFVASSQKERIDQIADMFASAIDANNN